MPSGKQRIRYHNHTKVLLCYVMAWGLALLIPFVLLAYVFPYTLAGSAPQLVDPSASGLCLPMQAIAGLARHAARPTGQLLLDQIAMRDLIWRVWVGCATLGAWALALAAQLLWRARYVRPRSGARAAMGAVRTFRVTLLAIAAVCALGALGVYLAGVRWIAGRTAWDYAVYFGGFACTPLAAWACFRLAAPPAISGKKAFFKRL